MDKNTLVKIVNRDSGIVCYSIPEMGVNRQFMPRETKEITFGELESLSFQPGGDVILSDFLVIRNEEAAAALLGQVEPEYYYTAADVKNLMVNGTLDAFLDCLDFAPMGVLEVVKDLAVELPLNDMAKRDAILEKLDFNVTRAIEIKNTKFDGDSDDVAEKSSKPTRRVTVNAPAAENTGRRASAPKYNVVSTSK